MTLGHFYREELRTPGLGHDNLALVGRLLSTVTSEKKFVHGRYVKSITLVYRGEDPGFSASYHPEERPVRKTVAFNVTRLLKSLRATFSVHFCTHATALNQPRDATRSRSSPRPRLLETNWYKKIMWYLFPRYGPVELWRKIVEMVDDIGAKEVQKIGTDLVQER